MNNYTKFIGIDAHKKFCWVNVQDKTGKILDNKRIETDKETLNQFFVKFDAKTTAVIESTYNWMFVYDVVKKHVGGIKLANPLQTKAISNAKIKTDKVDAKTLCLLLRADLIPEVYVSSPSERDQKDLLRYRYSFVRIRTQLKNKIHSFMARYGYENPYSDLFCKPGIEYLLSLEWKDPLKMILERYIKQIEELSLKVKEVDNLINKKIQTTETMKLVMTIPGIGKISAYLIATEIGDIKRFSDYKHFVSYCGLVPGVHSSAGKTYHTKSKQRNKYLQTTFVEAAIPAIKASPILMAKYTRIKKTKNYNKAKMTVARKLAEAAYKVLTKQEKYTEGITIRKISSLS